MPKNETQELIGAAEAAAILHMDLRTVHRKIGRGDLPHVTKLPGLRGSYILDRAEIERLAATA